MLSSRSLVAGLALLAACATTPERPSEPAGRAGDGASCRFASSSGVAWGFQVAGRALVLQRGDDRLVLDGAVGPGGVRFDMASIERPDAVFVLAGGRRAIWDERSVEVDGARYEIGGGVERVDLDAPPGSAR